MAIIEPTVGQSNWGPVLNTALTQLDTVGPSGGFHAQTLSVAGAATIDASTGHVQKITLGANATSSSITNPSTGQRMTIEWTQDGTGGRSYVWPANVIWTQGSAPTATRKANSSDLVTFIYDGTNWVELGRVLGVQTTAQTPTAAAGANAGTSPPAPIVAAGSTDLRGAVTCGTGTTPAAGALVVVTFAQTYAAAPVSVQFTPSTAAAALLLEYISTFSTTGFTVNVQAAPAASQAATVYGFHYAVAF